MHRLQVTSYWTHASRGYSHPPKVTNKEIGSIGPGLLGI